MKIYYYKQQQNTFALFDKKSQNNKRWYIAAASIVLMGGGLFFSLKNASHAPRQLSTLERLPTANSEAYFQNLSQDAETQATTANIQNNIQQNSLALEDTPKKSTGQPVTLKVGLQTQTYTIKPKDTLGKIFTKAGLSQKELAAVLKTNGDISTLKHLKLGQKLTLTLNEEKKLQQLSYVIDPTSTLTINRAKDSFTYALKTLPLETRQDIAKFVVFGSVNASAKKAGLDAKRTAQLAAIFKNSIDFKSGNHTGDAVSVLSQSYYLNGKKVKDGEIIAAEYKTATNTYQAVRFTDPNGNSGYYAPDGTSMQKRFLPAPLKFTRISSLFNPKRWHPVLHRFRHHEGVDYAAPYGTPIKSVASGTIAILGRKGGYGNTIMIKHDNSYSTLYGHLSKYAANLKVGSHVQQGQLIGYVGSSGLATGPHLHFEFRINGVHRNPLTVALPNGKSITHAYRNKFHTEVKKLLAKLDAHKKASSGSI